jgi:hypothetical protein
MVSFVMPAGMELSDMPLPKNANVKLRQINEHYAAAISFKGITTWRKVSDKESELRNILTREKINPSGPMKIARFDPPWKPGFMRHNEVVIPVSGKF